MQITGKIDRISPKTIIGQKQLEKLQIQVTEQEGQYPNSLIIDFIDKWVKFAEKCKLWEIVEVEFTSRVSEYKEKKYNSIKGWTIKPVATTAWDDLPF